MPEPARNEDQFLTVEEVAKRLQVSIGLVYRWLSTGRLQGQKLPGRAYGMWRITPTALQAFLDHTQR